MKKKPKTYHLQISDDNHYYFCADVNNRCFQNELTHVSHGSVAKMGLSKFYIHRDPKDIQDLFLLLVTQ